MSSLIRCDSLALVPHHTELHQHPNQKQNRNLFSHFHFTTTIQPLQPIWSSMFNNTQIHFTNKGSANHISTTSTINNQVAHLVLYITSHLEDIFLLLITIIFLDLNLKYAPYNQGLLNR